MSLLKAGLQAENPPYKKPGSGEVLSYGVVFNVAADAFQLTTWS
jgi:hypothetical protein